MEKLRNEPKYHNSQLPKIDNAKLDNEKKNIDKNTGELI